MTFIYYLIELALKKQYGREIKLSKLDDSIELATHENLVNKPY